MGFAPPPIPPAGTYDPASYAAQVAAFTAHMASAAANSFQAPFGIAVSHARPEQE